MAQRHPTRRRKRDKSKRVVCERCNKQSFPAGKPDVIIRNAINSSKHFGKPIRFYTCPHDVNIVHLTTNGNRSRGDR